VKVAERSQDGSRERVLARLRPAVRRQLKEASAKWSISESRLVEMGLEKLLSKETGDDPLSAILRGVESLNQNVIKLHALLDSQGELLGHFIFQHFTTAPMVRRGEEQAVKIAATQRFAEFLLRMQMGMAAGKSIFELSQTRPIPSSQPKDSDEPS